ncbi:MAG: hypothetical protein HGB00_09095 [Chlorobiaceae bacterium]|nr:hypothetical protein [Chlorobiaceae bacterium]
MPFNWLNKKTTEPKSGSRLAIKVAGTPAPKTLLSGNDHSPRIDIKHLDMERIKDEPVESGLGFIEIHPQGRCGFTTGVHDPTLQSVRNMSEEIGNELPENELLRDKVPAAESLEECLKIIGTEVFNSLSEKHPEESVKAREEKDSDSDSDFSLWGNRIRK